MAIARNHDAPLQLEMYLVCAVATILAIRAGLYATGYPQLGGGGIHIAHMLWGGLLMFAAQVICLLFLGPHVKRVSCILGGVGFGMFIDELGKFITSDNDYFFRPTAAILYVLFALLFLLLKLVGEPMFQPNNLSKEENLVNAYDLLAQHHGGRVLSAENRTLLEEFVENAADDDEDDVDGGCPVQQQDILVRYLIQMINELDSSNASLSDEANNNTTAGALGSTMFESMSDLFMFDRSSKAESENNENTDSSAMATMDDDESACSSGSSNETSPEHGVSPTSTSTGSTLLNTISPREGSIAGGSVGGTPPPSVITDFNFTVIPELVPQVYHKKMSQPLQRTWTGGSVASPTNTQGFLRTQRTGAPMMIGHSSTQGDAFPTAISMMTGSKSSNNISGGISNGLGVVSAGSSSTRHAHAQQQQQQKQRRNTDGITTRHGMTHHHGRRRRKRARTLVPLARWYLGTRVALVKALERTVRLHSTRQAVVAFFFSQALLQIAEVGGFLVTSMSSASVSASVDISVTGTANPSPSGLGIDMSSIGHSKSPDGFDLITVTPAGPINTLHLIQVLFMSVSCALSVVGVAKRVMERPNGACRHGGGVFGKCNALAYLRMSVLVRLLFTDALLMYQAQFWAFSEAGCTMALLAVLTFMARAEGRQQSANSEEDQEIERKAARKKAKLWGGTRAHAMKHHRSDLRGNDHVTSGTVGPHVDSDDESIDDDEHQPLFNAHDRENQNKPTVNNNINNNNSNNASLPPRQPKKIQRGYHNKIQRGYHYHHSRSQSHGGNRGIAVGGGGRSSTNDAWQHSWQQRHQRNNTSNSKNNNTVGVLELTPTKVMHDMPTSPKF